jgi:hypothetical protein
MNPRVTNLNYPGLLPSIRSYLARNGYIYYPNLYRWIIYTDKVCGFYYNGEMIHVDRDTTLGKDIRDYYGEHRQ